jgi:Na+-transporting NADH:ubiquinone oxidoreductase subunit NqrB
MKGKAMSETDPESRQNREAWKDYKKSQEFEHLLIDRKTTWLLTTQAILFAAYGLTLSGDVETELADGFRKAVAWSGVLVGAIIFLGASTLIISKWRSWRDYREYFGGPPNDLPTPLNRRWLQWGVRTLNTGFTLVPDVLLPLVFVGGWLYLLRR